VNAPGEAGGRRGADAGDLLLGLLLSLLAALLCTWLYLRSEAAAAPGQVPVGILADDHLIHVGAVYGSFAREAQEGGGISVHNHQTSLPHGDRLHRPWDAMIGWLGALFGLGPRGLFHLDRWLATLLFGPCMALLLGELLASRAVRRGALCALFSGGSLYWLCELVGRESGFGRALRTWLEAYHPGLSGLGFAPPALILGAPHLLLELVFMGAALAFALRAVRTGGLWWALPAGLALLGQAWVRPYTVPVSVLGVVLLLGPGLFRSGVRLRALAGLTLALSPVVPHLLHLRGVVSGETIFSSLDVSHPAPPSLEQLWFQGPSVLLAALLLLPAVRRRRRALGAGRESLLLATLLVGNLALTHGEPLVRWEVEAMLPLFLLATLLGARAVEALPARWLGAVGVGFLLLNAAPTAGYLLEVERGLEHEGGPYWISSDEQAALDWLQEQRPEDALTRVQPPIALLCHPALGRLVPWLGGVRVALGHPDHTPHWDSILHRAKKGYYRFGAVLGELAEGGVTHILWGPREDLWRAPSSVYDPLEDERLVLAFESGAVRVFSVLPGAKR